MANAAGINVDKTRVIAMIFSTVLASWGQLIFLQNVGTLSTYGAHTQVGQFAIAALLVGGASVQNATNKQALLGIVLFHTLFIVSPLAGKELFGDPAIGEYFRVFVSYGVIAMSLAMHAWKKATGKEARRRRRKYLLEWLLADGRMEDAKRAVADEQVRKDLYRELGITGESGDDLDVLCAAESFFIRK